MLWRLFLVFTLFQVARAWPGFVKRSPNTDSCGYQAILNGSFPLGRPVYGVQPIGDEIYVIRDSTPYIEVYDRITFQRKGNLSVNGMQGPYDMVQSTQNQASLFIADWFNTKNLFTVRIPQENVSSFSTTENNFTTLGLGGSNLYTNGNIVVIDSTSQMLRKFGVSGNLVTEIAIQNISSPRQSIQVGPDTYAVCQGYGPPPALHRVCLINATGEIIKCYGSTSGSGIGQFNIPGRLELIGNDCIAVADTGNKRVVLLNKNLEYVSDLISSGLDGPYRLYFDRENKLLFVADNQVDSSGIAVFGRIFVFKIYSNTESDVANNRSHQSFIYNKLICLIFIMIIVFTE